MFRLFKKQFPVGIDISDYSIEILQLNERKEVLAYGRITLERGIVENGKILNKEKLAAKLKEVLKSTKPNSLKAISYKLKAILSLPESKVFIHYFELPRDLEGKELTKQVLKETSKVIPFDPGRLYWDYQIIKAKKHKIEEPPKDRVRLDTPGQARLPAPDGAADGGQARPPRLAEHGGQVEKQEKFLSVLYAGVLTEIVDEYIEVADRAGITLIALDVESVSLGRALLPSPQGSADVWLNTLAEDFEIGAGSIIVDIGARTTIISVFDGEGTLTISLSIPVGGHHFTKSIADKLGIDEGDAEKLKREFGFDDTKSNNKVLPILQADFQKILQEIKNAARFYEQKRGRDIEEIILAGGSSLLPNIEAYISLNMGKGVRIASPLEKIKKGAEVFDKEISPVFFSTVTGLALRAAEKSALKNDINLLPHGYKAYKSLEIQEQRRRETEKEVSEKNVKHRFVMQIIIPSLIGLVLIFGFLGWYYRGVFMPKTEIVSPPVSQPILQEEQEGSLGGAKDEGGGEEGEEVLSPSVEESLAGESEEIEEEVSQIIVTIKDTPAGWLNVRRGPGMNHEQFTRVNPQETYELLEESGRWYKIKLSKEQEGWIYAAYADKAEEKAPGVIIKDTPTGWLNAREGPGTNHEQFTRVNPQETYELLEESGRWYKIKLSEEQAGWIYAAYADKIELSDK